MQPLRLLLLLFVVLVLSSTLVRADQPLSGRDIMIRVDERPDGEDRTATMRMTLINQRERTREREIHSLSKDYGKDKKTVMFFLKPADVRGTAFLSWDYDDPAREDDRWLYLPAMKKERRISGRSNNDSFMGSDFTYDDMGDRSVNEDEHRLLREEELDGKRCWVVESLSRNPEETCRRRILWIAQDWLLALRIDYFDKDGLYRRYQGSDIRTVDGYVTVFRREMTNLTTGHRTVLAMDDVRFDQGIDDEVFTVSSLQRGRLR